MYFYSALQVFQCNAHCPLFSTDGINPADLPRSRARNKPYALKGQLCGNHTNACPANENSTRHTRESKKIGRHLRTRKGRLSAGLGARLARLSKQIRAAMNFAWRFWRESVPQLCAENNEAASAFISGTFDRRCPRPFPPFGSSSFGGSALCASDFGIGAILRHSFSSEFGGKHSRRGDWIDSGV